MKKCESFAFAGSMLELLPESLIKHADLLNKVTAIAAFGSALKGQLCYCDRIPRSWNPHDHSTVLCTPEVQKELAVHCGLMKLIVVKDARASFIDLIRRLVAAQRIEPTSLIPRPMGIADSARIGEQTIIDSDVRVDDDVVIGAHCIIHAGTWIQRGCKIADGTVIGTSGINSYATLDGRILDFPHLAGVIIGENVQIGANSVIARGILTSTVIDPQSTIGNLCNIGHGAIIGERCWMSVGCLIGGHTCLEKGATLGIGSVVRDNLKIGENAQIGMGSVVVRNVSTRSSVFGNPARPIPSINAGPKR
jgi:UDP-3-O-[3-hydroxymyristoyl] glucosamine N-acyltransferase